MHDLDSNGIAAAAAVATSSGSAGAFKTPAAAVATGLQTGATCMDPTDLRNVKGLTSKQRAYLLKGMFGS